MVRVVIARYEPAPRRRSRETPGRFVDQVPHIGERRRPRRHVSTEIAKAAGGEKDLLMLRLSIFSACSPAGDKNNETCTQPLAEPPLLQR